MDADTTAKKGFSCRVFEIVIVFFIFVIFLFVVGFIVLFLKPCTDHDETAANRERFLLPTSIMPIHYDLLIQPHFNNFTFNGSVKILVKILQITDKIVVHIRELNILNVTLTSPSEASVPNMKSVTEEKETEFFTVYLAKKLVANRNYTLEMNFTGILNQVMAGFYRSWYINAEGEKVWLATTQFESTDARRAFPCFDEPAMKATFNVTIVRQKNMTSLSNMPMYESRNRDDVWVEDHFEKSVTMSTYLVAYVVSDFVSIKSQNSSINFQIWTRPNAIESATYASDIGPRLLQFFEEYLDFKYPLSKMDFVGVPDFEAGAMENWGLITYRERRLLHSEQTSIRVKISLADIISHELAHQWFGNLVTMRWWNDIWLNEGFASYFSIIGVGNVQPEWQIENVLFLDTLDDAFDGDEKGSFEMARQVYDPKSISRKFNSIAYAKGASIIRMMRHFLGNDTFQKGIQRYLKEKQYDNAVTDDLWENLVKESNQNINASNFTSMMKTWILQPGYPLVTLTRDYGKNSGTLEQKRFQVPIENSTEMWHVPITFTDGQNPDWTTTTKFVMTESKFHIPNLPSGDYWVLVNVQQVGYYRVNYDERNWDLLFQQLETDHTRIHEINRAQILNDLASLISSEQIKSDKAFNATLYLNKETELIVWRSAMGLSDTVRGFLKDEDAKSNWWEHIQSKLVSQYELLGWRELESDSIQKIWLRGLVLERLCRNGYNPCVLVAVENFEQWLENDKRNFNNSQVPTPNLRHIVFCAGLRHSSGSDNWEYLMKRLRNETNISLRHSFMDALSCTNNTDLLSKYLNIVTEEEIIRFQEGAPIFNVIAKSDVGKQVVLQYSTKNWEKIVRKFGVSKRYLNDVFLTVCKSVTSKAGTDILNFFINNVKRYLKDSKSTIKECLSLRKK